MKRKLLKYLMIVGAVLSMVGCVEGYTPEEKPVELPEGVQKAIDGPESNLTDAQDLKDAITFMYSEEDLAYSIYTAIYKVQKVMELQNIALNSEVKHIEAVNQIAQKYDLNMTQYPDTDVHYSIAGIGNGTYPVPPVQDLYTILYEKGIQSKKDALEVGCMVEVIDVNDLDTSIQLAQTAKAKDILTVFNFLRNGSYTHYWAFNDALMMMNDPDDNKSGCCSLGDDYCKIDVYPKKDMGGM